jgi:twitching motility protein PilJ
MASSTQYAQRYQQAVSAYMQGHYESAATWTDTLLSEHPDDPNLQLLCGHIYSCLQQYDLAQQHYEHVLHSTKDAELLDCAQSSLANVAQIQGDDSAEDMIGHAEDWSEMSVYSDSDETRLQLGLKPQAESRGGAQSKTGLGSASVANFPKNAGPDRSWSHSLPDEADVNNNFFESDREVLEASSDLFDEDEEITLLMGKKGSKKLEGVMPDEQFPEGSTNPIHHPMMDSSKVDSGDLDLDHLGLETIAPDEALSSQELNDDEFGNFLDHSEDPSGLDLLNELERSAPLQNSESFGSETGFDDHNWANDDLSDEGANTGILNAEPSQAQITDDNSGLVRATGTASAVVASPTRQSDRAALNIASRRLPLLAPFEDAPLHKKQLIMAVSTGAISGLAVVLAGQLAGISGGAKIGLGLAAGLAGGATTLALSQVITRQLKASTSDLQTKLAAVGQGDWGVKAIEFSEDEFGHLARSFNQMTQFIESTTKDAQRKADDQEKAKEDLQRQVIRLLDDVEGAARGDLTVQAEVTADILGAVADSFNLTIFNLQKIVKQVKVAAREVNRGAADNEEFARGLSSDALRQAEELAATLNSVQMMTSSIQEVADSARAADRVAQQASEAALRGGESVESTVAGILQIRETVAETTRKVKRLAESSQEISKIVGLISQIASRTNLLALNASIEAARAGESGRGFAVVADEVRQLADRAAKASKEIEQIVLQIQGETSSVMTAMEEGTQQVIEGTQRAEQAKHSLDDIIQVSDQIKKLVGSITKATSEQTETSRYVAQVMQSVELTAQETSQEAQRVSDSLRNLVGVARDLQSSVERFKVEGTEFT